MNITLFNVKKFPLRGYWVLCRISSVMLYEPVFRILSTNFVVLLFFLYWFYFSLLNYELLLIDHMLLQCPIPVNWVWMWRFYQWFFFCQIKLIHSDKYLTPWLSHLKFAFPPQNFTNSKIYIIHLIYSFCIWFGNQW